MGGPDTYEECILENMKGVQSNLAAREIARSCRRKFPLIERLPKAYFAKVSAKAHTDANRFYATIFNNCDNWKITAVQFKIRHMPPLPEKPDFADLLVEQNPELAEMVTASYMVETEIGPHGRTTAAIPIGWDATKGYKWEIVFAKGHRVTE